MQAEEIMARVFAIGGHIRYVAVANGQDVRMRQRPGLIDASSSESDRFEELLVNPTVLVLTRQRGEVDCGGLRYVMIRYGSFTQVVVPRPAGGHVSAAVATGQDPVAVADTVERMLA
jgi:hypothetical protein